MNGSGAQQLGSAGGPAITFKNLSWTVSGTKTCSTSVSVAGTLTPAGTAVLASGGNLTLKSTSSQTANVTAGSTSGNYITGNVSVERYIPSNSNRAWRILAVNTSGSQTIRSAWQEGATSGSSNPNPGYGTQITCSPDYTTANGFDDINPGYRNSIAIYDATNNDSRSTPVANTNFKLLSSETAYFLYVRGDRTCTNNNSTITATTLRSTGVLYTGDQSAVSVLAGKFALMGNPYPSPIDFSLISSGDRSNLLNKFWLWDAKLGSMGGYQLFDASLSWVPVPGGGSYGTTANSVIQSGQGFFVKSSGSAGSLVIREAHKSSTSNNLGFKSTVANQLLRISLDEFDVENSPKVVDGVVAAFSDDANAGIDSEDADKPVNINESLAIKRAGHLLMVEKRPTAKTNDTLFLNIDKLQKKSYQLSFSKVNMTDPGKGIFLFDNFTHEFTSFDNMPGTGYDFTVTDDTGTYASNRFMVVFADTTQSYPGTTGVISTYPNPVTGNLVNLKFNNLSSGNYSVYVASASGQAVYQSEIVHLGGSNTYPINLPGNLAVGPYMMRIVQPDETWQIIKLQIQQ